MSAHHHHVIRTRLSELCCKVVSTCNFQLILSEMYFIAKREREIQKTNCACVGLFGSMGFHGGLLSITVLPESQNIDVAAWQEIDHAECASGRLALTRSC